MKSLRTTLELNVLVEMAAANCEFKQLLMRDPLRATQEYNRQMVADSSPVVTLPYPEVELLERVAGATDDFRQFCRLLSDERDRLDREEQRRAMELLRGNQPSVPKRNLRTA